MTSSGARYILTALDSFTRYPIAIPIPSKESKVVAKAMFDNYISLFGLPKIIFSDQALEFRSVLLKVCRMLGIQKMETTGYQPQANGQVEKFHRFMNESLSVLSKQSDKWDEMLPSVLFAYRTTIHRSTGFSPYELMFGREPRLPAQVCFGYDDDDDTTRPDYAKELSDRLRGWYREARKKQDAMRREYKERKGKPKMTYKVGDTVLYWTPGSHDGVPKKLSERWTGPFKVVKVREPTHCVINTGRSEVLSNVNRLCLYEPFVLPDPFDDESPDTFDARTTHNNQQEQPVRYGDGAVNVDADGSNNGEGRAQSDSMTIDKPVWHDSV